MGTAGQKAFMREMITNNPDLHLAIEYFGADGDMLFIRATATTNNPTTGAPEPTVFLEIDQIANGKMVESWTLAGPGPW